MTLALGSYGVTMRGNMWDSFLSTQGNNFLLDFPTCLLVRLICWRRCLSLIHTGVLQLTRLSATHIWHLFMISMRSLFAPGLSVLILSNQLLLKKISRSLSIGNLWNSIQIQFIEVYVLICCIMYAFLNWLVWNKYYIGPIKFSRTRKIKVHGGFRLSLKNSRRESLAFSLPLASLDVCNVSMCKKKLKQKYCKGFMFHRVSLKPSWCNSFYLLHRG